MGRIKTVYGGAVAIPKTVDKLLRAAALEAEISRGEFIRRGIDDEMKNATLANYTPHKWTAKFVAVCPQFRITPKVSAKIDERLEYLHAHPNNKGWTPDCWADYIRAILEHTLEIDKIAAKVKAKAEKANAYKEAAP